MPTNTRRDRIIRNMRSHGLSTPMSMMFFPLVAKRMIEDGELIADGVDKNGKTLWRLSPELLAPRLGGDRDG